jgi:hypothetical protein
MATTRTTPCKAKADPSLAEVALVGIRLRSSSSKQQAADSSSVPAVVGQEASRSISQVAAVELYYDGVIACLANYCIITYCMFGDVHLFSRWNDTQGLYLNDSNQPCSTERGGREPVGVGSCCTNSPFRHCLYI